VAYRPGSRDNKAVPGLRAAGMGQLGEQSHRGGPAKEAKMPVTETTAAEECRYAIPEYVEVAKLDALDAPSPLLVVVNGKRYEVSGLAASVLRCLCRGPSTLQEVAATLNTTGTTTFDTDQLRTACGHLVETGMITRDGEPAPSPRKRRKWSPMAIRLPLLPGRVVTRLAAPLGWLLSPDWMKRVVPVLGAFQILFVSRNFSLVSQLAHRHPTGWELTLLLGGSYSALLFHELGHAAACCRQGARVGPIGLSIYLVFPSLYTDVTDAWRLGRKQRAVVDAAGIYFSLLAATIGAVLFLTTGHRDFGLVAIACDVTALFNINPFVRADGYWLVSDALGVPNLMALNRRMTVWLAKRLIGRKEPRPFLLSQHPAVGRVYMAYYVLFAAFFCWAGAAFYGWYLPHLLVGYPRLVMAAAEAVRHGAVLAALSAAGRLAGAMIPLVGLLIYSGRGLRRLGPAAARAARGNWCRRTRAVGTAEAVTTPVPSLRSGGGPTSPRAWSDNNDH